jgi:asparagine synthase (glutamine-hydrolysing)
LPFGEYLPTGSVAYDPLDSVTALEFANYLPDQLLRDADQMSMAHSIELRVPLLDDEVVVAALSLPARDRIGVLGKKSVLHDALPIAKRPKRPFTLPFDTWMRGELSPWLRESLLSDSLPFSQQIPVGFRRNLLAAFDAGRTHWSRPWTVAVLRRWMESKGLGG